jgi:hypothetical protein
LPPGEAPRAYDTTGAEDWAAGMQAMAASPQPAARPLRVATDEREQLQQARARHAAGSRGLPHAATHDAAAGQLGSLLALLSQPAGERSPQQPADDPDEQAQHSEQDGEPDASQPDASQRQHNDGRQPRSTTADGRAKKLRAGAASAVTSVEELSCAHAKEQLARCCREQREVCTQLAQARASGNAALITRLEMRSGQLRHEAAEAQHAVHHQYVLLVYIGPDGNASVYRTGPLASGQDTTQGLDSAMTLMVSTTHTARQLQVCGGRGRSNAAQHRRAAGTATSSWAAHSGAHYGRGGRRWRWWGRPVTAQAREQSCARGEGRVGGMHKRCMPPIAHTHAPHPPVMHVPPTHPGCRQSMDGIDEQQL